MDVLGCSLLLGGSYYFDITMDTHNLDIFTTLMFATWMILLLLCCYYLDGYYLNVHNLDDFTTWTFLLLGRFYYLDVFTT